MFALSQILRRLPSVDQILQGEVIAKLVQTYSRELLVVVIHEHLEELRAEIRTGHLCDDDLERELACLQTGICSRLQQRLCPSLRPVINATGVIIHTNVGRAPISDAIAQTMRELAAGYSNLEYSLDKGKRGHRDLHFEKQMTRLLSCEAAAVCNNNAAAVFLILNTLARGRKVLVSRGELIEIGGSFRLPAIMECSGAILKEVGTTNKTNISDYREAIDDETALIFRVHPSNYKITGFTHRPPLQDLIQLAGEKNIPLVKDVGSGYLFRTSHPFLKDEPTVHSALIQGVNLACFSGDKLLGGPQAGIIVGERELVEEIRASPLMRACRADKVTYSALEWTLIEYEKGTYEQTIPIYRMLSLHLDEIKRRAQNLSKLLDSRVFQTKLKEGFSLIGGGSAPEEQIPTFLLAVESPRYSVNEIECRLRKHSPPVLARIEHEQLVLDLRTVFPEQEKVIASVFGKIAAD